MTTPSKKILVFCDGTGLDGLIASDILCDQGASKATNVLRLSRAVKPFRTDSTGRKIPQITFYQSGVGSDSDFNGQGFTTAKLIQAYGRVVASKIRDAYTFIAQNYESGDEIYLFGYSRGAYTARKVAGLIDRIGLLSRRDLGQFFDICSRLQKDPNSVARPTTEIPVKCVGVWDTVGSVTVPKTLGGIVTTPVPKEVLDSLGLTDCSLPNCVKMARHAVAFHENRDVMRVTLWDAPTVDGDNRVKQVWFGGGHSDIGGGGEFRELADITLFWMATEIDSLIELDHSMLWGSHIIPPKGWRGGWGAAQPYNGNAEDMATRVFGSTTREAQITGRIATRLHASLRQSPQPSNPRNMLTVKTIKGTVPKYVELTAGTLEHDLMTKWNSSGQAFHPESPQSVFTRLPATFLGGALDVVGGVVRVSADIVGGVTSALGRLWG
ncbi:hypothetical protein M408DRAFT_30240 [Serendipita vermifera MAFF 305830]|uniref:T6SS Phospholipase effector Tle1-like catalytic domain-containing protein n=1 Tax=Serendipita vermifera MAFF 305830 TaxID=933852 RepID=A0A0C2W259_SERVB|nr:hypothetical protein M408DRAFT_30240 [Serendipita vermifera MAFF 305830]